MFLRRLIIYGCVLLTLVPFALGTALVGWLLWILLHVDQPEAVKLFTPAFGLWVIWDILLTYTAHKAWIEMS